jgi:hypothetical protein
MKSEAEKIDNQQGDGVLPCVISRFFKEMAEKHKVKVDDLNIHISYNQLYIQEYTPNQRNEFKCLEIVDLNGL